MTFGELNAKVKVNEPFTIYKQLSSVRYEERQAVIFEKNENSFCFCLLQRNSTKMARGNFATTWMEIRKWDYDKENTAAFYLNKPENATIVKKITKTIVVN